MLRVMHSKPSTSHVGELDGYGRSVPATKTSDPLATPPSPTQSGVYSKLSRTENRTPAAKKRSPIWRFRSQAARGNNI